MISCPWCGSAFEPRVGGKRQKFCRPGHRRVFDRAARAYVVRGVKAGTITHAQLQASTQRNAALGRSERGVGFPPSDVSWTRPA